LEKRLALVDVDYRSRVAVTEPTRRKSRRIMTNASLTAPEKVDDTRFEIRPSCDHVRVTFPFFLTKVDTPSRVIL
jgi:hypothetical protein